MVSSPGGSASGATARSCQASREPILDRKYSKGSEARNVSSSSRACSAVRAGPTGGGYTPLTVWPSTDKSSGQSDLHGCLPGARRSEALGGGAGLLPIAKGWLVALARIFVRAILRAILRGEGR